MKNAQVLVFNFETRVLLSHRVSKFFYSSKRFQILKGHNVGIHPLTEKLLATYKTFHHSLK